MRKAALTLLLTLAACAAGFAQTAADSLAIASIRWNTEKLQRGVAWKSAQLELYGSPQSISIIELKPSCRNKLAIAYCVDTLIETSLLCKGKGAKAGVNASFFDMKNGGSVDYMRVNGATIHQGRATSRSSNAAITISGRKVDIVKQHKDSLWAQELEAENVLVAGPMLVNGSAVEALPQSAFNTARHPRTAVAITSNGRVLLVAVDGRHENHAAGMTTKELAFFLKVLGATKAMNFDGGGSTAMYIRGKDDGGIVNFPSDNKAFDHKGERRVANVLYLK